MYDGPAASPFELFITPSESDICRRCDLINLSWLKEASRVDRSTFGGSDRPPDRRRDDERHRLADHISEFLFFSFHFPLRSYPLSYSSIGLDTGEVIVT